MAYQPLFGSSDLGGMDTRDGEDSRASDDGDTDSDPQAAHQPAKANCQAQQPMAEAGKKRGAEERDDFGPLSRCFLRPVSSNSRRDDNIYRLVRSAYDCRWRSRLE